MKIILLTLFLLFIIGGIYWLSTYFTAVLEVKASPREPMYECPKHGLIRKKHLITFKFDNIKDPYEQCPFCYNEKMKTPFDASVSS